MSSLLSPTESTESAQRRERAAIAAQACQTCRTRKSKCDEQRPKCGLCHRLNLECIYREPLPTKKDKTMVHILETLARLENKFDNLALTNSAATPNVPLNGLEHRELVEPRSSYHHRTLNHKVILWPSIYLHLLSVRAEGASDLHHILQEGFPWFMKQEIAAHQQNRLSTASLPSFEFGAPCPLPGPRRVAFPSLTSQRISDYCHAYFNTFNSLVPLLNKDNFDTEILQPVAQNGFGNDDAESVLMLLVLALGQLAEEGVFGRSMSTVDGTSSGFRGGSITNPPGIEIFNEARTRFGFISSQVSLMNVQILLLQATYYDATSRHLDSWRSSMAASQACLVLIKFQTIDWQTGYGDLIKRAYWACVLREDFHRLEPDLPPSGIHQLEDIVPVPNFQNPSRHSGSPFPSVRNEDQLPQYHFLAMIALRRLILRIDQIIQECRRPSVPTIQRFLTDQISTAFQDQADSKHSYTGPQPLVLREMTRQLESWRSLLPRALQWEDSSPLDFPHVHNTSTSRSLVEPLFYPDEGSIPVSHKFNLDVAAAQLRSRFYYARFTMYRPFVYKALHFPELVTPEDASLCAQAIKSALLWPIIMAPTKNKKRLIPHLVGWTQNILCILLILRMTTESQCLKRICDEQVNKADLRTTSALMLAWMRDLQQVDAISAWSWKLLEPLYANGL